MEGESKRRRKIRILFKGGREKGHKLGEEGPPTQDHQI